MSHSRRTSIWAASALAVAGSIPLAWGQLTTAGQPPKPAPPLLPPLADPKAPDFATLMARMKAAKPDIAKKHNELLAARYDLSDRAAADGKMTRGKPVQQGPRAKLPNGTTWAALAAVTPEQVREKGLFPAGFLPLPHPNHPEGGMLFPKFHINEVLKQEARDLNRFDWTSTCRRSSCRPSRRRSFSPRGRTWVTCRRVSWSRSRTSTSCSTAS